MRAIRYLLVGLTLAIAGAIAGILLLAATPAGFAWLAGNADKVVPGRLELQNPGGSLLTTMQVSNAGYELDGLRIDAGNVGVRLNWLALIAGEVRLSRLQADRLQIVMTAADSREANTGLPEVDIPLALRIVSGNIDSVELDVPGYRGEFAGLEIRAALRGSRLRLFDLKARAFGLPLQVSGELTMRGKWEYSGSASTRLDKGALQQAQLPAAELRAAFAGDAEQVEITDLLVETLDGRITGKGTLRFADLALQASLQARDINAGALQASLPDLAEASIDIAGRLPDALQIGISNARLRQGQRVAEVSGRVSWNGRSAATPGLGLRVAGNRLDYNGELWPVTRGRFALLASEPGALLPELSGRIEARGTVTIAESIAVAASATGEAIAWQGAPLADRLQLEITGSDSRQRWQLGVQSPLGEAEIAGSSNLGAQELSLQIDTAELVPASTAAWQLSGPLVVEIDLGGAGSAQVEAHCWAGEPWRVCVDSAAWSPEAFRLDAHLEPLQLTDLPALSSLGYRIDGSARAQLSIGGTPDNPVGRLLWQQQDTRIAWTDDDGNTLQSVFADTQAEVLMRDRRLRLSARTKSDSGIAITAAADSAPWQAAATPLTGRLNAEVADIGILAPLLDRFAGLDNVGGTANVSLQLSGTLGEPALRGSAELTDGSASLRALGIELTEILLDVAAADSTELRFDGSARSGEGQLLLEGTANRNGNGRPSARLTVSGENVTVLRFPEQVVTASPNLALELADDTLRVTGDLLVPYADITVEQVPPAASSPSRDVKVIRAKTAEKRAAALTVISDIRIMVGDNVRFRAFGLETRLGGQLRLYTTAENQLPYLDGNVRSLEGSFAAFGRQLDIERGVLIFSGVPDNPNVDVRAVRKLRYEGQDIKIVIRLSGPLQAMQTSLSGEPAMSESDALSYLVLNRPARRSETGENEQLSAAAMALGLVNLLPQTETLRNTLGIDEIEFEGSTRETSAISAGKRVGEDLYIRYSYGLFERVGRFIIRYEIGNGFSLEAGSGQEQTIDLLYSIDR